MPPIKDLRTLDCFFKLNPIPHNIELFKSAKLTIARMNVITSELYILRATFREGIEYFDIKICLVELRSPKSVGLNI